MPFEKSIEKDISYLYISENPYDDDDLDALIKSMDEEYSSIDKDSSAHEICQLINKDISNEEQPQIVDWNKVLEAAKNTNKTNKRQEEEIANQKIAAFIQSNLSVPDIAIQRMFHRKTSKNRRRKTP
jgi:hypothetical protein